MFQRKGPKLIVLSALSTPSPLTVGRPHQAPPQGSCDSFSAASESHFWDCVCILSRSTQVFLPHRGQGHPCQGSLPCPRATELLVLKSVRIQPHTGTRPWRNWAQVWLFHLTPVLSMSSNHPPPYRQSHTLTNTSLLNFKKVISWHTGMHIIWGHSLSMLKNKWDHRSVHRHFIETMFIIFMNMEMYSHLPESLAWRTGTLFAIGEKCFSCRFKKILPRIKNMVYGLGRKV